MYCRHLDLPILLSLSADCCTLISSWEKLELNDQPRLFGLCLLVQEFAKLMFEHCEALRPLSGKYNELFEHFRSWKGTIPTAGMRSERAIIVLVYGLFSILVSDEIDRGNAETIHVYNRCPVGFSLFYVCTCH